MGTVRERMAGRCAARTISQADVPARPTPDNETSEPAASARHRATRSRTNASRKTGCELSDTSDLGRNEVNDLVGLHQLVGRDDTGHRQSCDDRHDDFGTFGIEVSGRLVKYQQ